MQTNNTEQNVAIITGAAGGIGQALVKTFAQAGYFVIAVDQIACLNDLNANAYLQVDLAKTVSDEDYATSVFTDIRRLIEAKPLKVLINNAAVQILGKTEELTRTDWQSTLQVNLLAPFFWTQALLPELEAAQGSVVNISSIHARLTKKNFVAYATSKAALSGMTRAMAVDLGTKIRVNCIEPAAINTEMLRASFTDNPAKLMDLAKCHPSDRIGDPLEVARVALFLSERGIDFMNGSNIALDGGISVKLNDPL